MKICCKCGIEKELKKFEIKYITNEKVVRRNVCNTCLEKQRCLVNPERKAKREKARTKKQLLRRWKNRDVKYTETLHKTYIKSLLRRNGIKNPSNELIDIKRIQIILKRKIRIDETANYSMACR